MKLFLVILGLSGQPDVALTHYATEADCRIAQENLLDGRWTDRPVMADCREMMEGLEWFRQ